LADYIEKVWAALPMSEERIERRLSAIFTANFTG
jgi:hypothetical protein